jgi:predicted metalloprotease with PDZ domain
MAVWTPGSYLVREYARHIEGLHAEAPARATKVRKNAWRIEGHDSESIVVRYRVYANELTVRTSHVDESHAFLVGAALFLALEGHEHLGARVEFDVPRDWRIFTSLKASGTAFEAADFDTLVDSTIEIGTQREEHFDVLGKPHRFAFWPARAINDSDVRRLADDTQAILREEARLFGGELPYDSYEFLFHLSSKSRGGLEHRTSAALLVPRTSFLTRDGYLDLLSLVAHEVFHAWNVKRIRPAGLVPYRYEQECYTRLLWWFEGATSYYDWRILALARLCTIEEYLDHLASEIAYLDQTPGRLVQPLEDASFDAWIKLYRPDENTPNGSVSYYRKGEVVCALLDLALRARRPQGGTLDAVVSLLWSEYGARDRAVPEDAMQEIFERVAGEPMGELFDAWIRSPAEIDYQAVLSGVGLQIERSPRPDGAPCSLGLRTRADGARTIVTSVLRETAAWTAGVDAGDEIVALGGIRVEGPGVDAILRGRSPGDPIEIVLSRDGLLVTKQATLDPPRVDRVRLVARLDAAAPSRDAFTAWLGSPHPAWWSTGTSADGGVVKSRTP